MRHDTYALAKIINQSNDGDGTHNILCCFIPMAGAIVSACEEE